MIRTVLVPLDGSSLGERALPLAVPIARAAQAELKLVHVAPARDHVEHPLPPTAQGYLDLMTFKVQQAAGVPAASALLHGPVTDALLEYAAGLPADLIVLTTHGRGALSRLWLGSVADQLVRRATMPLLLFRPGDDPQPHAAPADGFRRVLIPLDGSPAAEGVLGPATELGRLSGAAYTLLRVVEPMPLVAGDGMTYLPNAYDDRLLDELRKQAELYLAGIVERLRRDGFTATAQVVVGESSAAAVLDAAKSADLIALTTHGRTGVARFFLGGVADKVIRAADHPVLVVRVHES